MTNIDYITEQDVANDRNLSSKIAEYPDFHKSGMNAPEIN